MVPVKWLLLILAALADLSALAAPGDRPDFGRSARSARRLGIVSGLAANPVGSAEPPFTMLGFGARFNATEVIRGGAGVGWGNHVAGDGTGIAVGGSIQLLWPGWDFAPFIDLSATLVKATILETTTLYLPVPSIGLGMDWQSPLGLALGFGYRHPLIEARGQPYFSFGYFF